MPARSRTRATWPGNSRRASRRTTPTWAPGTGGSCVPADSGLNLGAKAGQVRVTKVAATSYTVAAKSESANVFKIVKDPKTGVISRKCTGAGGGCVGKKW